MISKSKWGDCSQCPKRNCACNKVGKELWCIDCNNRRKAIASEERQEEKQSAQKAQGKPKEHLACTDSKKNLIEDIDAVLSKYIRIRSSDDNGNCPCFTCPTVKHWTLMQNGHFVSRGNLSLRFDTKYNNNPQCFDCNVTLRGNRKVYAERLEEIEPGIVESLEEIGRKTDHTGIDELKQLLIDLRAKLKIVKSKLL